MKLVRIISRLILGVVFIFSGFVKALDPLGSAYKFSDYFHAFGLDFMDGLSLPLGIFLASFELVLGIVLLLGYQKKIVYWILLFFMTFFTILTLVLAISNPVSDCGCFGDAIIMTNWQTFFKNVVLMVFVLGLFGSRRHAKNVLNSISERALIALFFVIIMTFSVYCLRHLPVLDFRPYDVGSHIPSEMKIPDDAPRDEYRTILIYRNLENGEVSEFTIENYPQDTLAWEFVSSDSKLIKKGYEPPIHDFGIADNEGYDITDEILSFKGYTLFMSAYALEDADPEMLALGNAWSQLETFSANFNFKAVTAASSDVRDKIKADHGLEYSFYSADEIMLKTFVRANPGFVLLKNGTIMAKWTAKDFPAMEEWNPEWPELIAQYISEQDPEILMLIEEGYMDELNWDMIDFEQAAGPVVASKYFNRSEKGVQINFILLILLLLSLLFTIPQLKRGQGD